MAGTAVEVTPVNSVDDHEIGVGPITLELQHAYKDTVTGKSERWSQWVELAPASNPRLTTLDHAVLIRRVASAEPLGRQRPRANRRADTSPPYIGASR